MKEFFLPNEAFTWLKIILKSIKKLIAHPSLIIFYIYSFILSTLSMYGVIWAEKVVFLMLCWASKWKYFPLSKYMMCHDSPMSQLFGGLDNIVHLKDMPNIKQHITEIAASTSLVELFSKTVIFLIFAASIIIYFTFTHYFQYFSYTAMARYIQKLENNEKQTPLQALSLDKPTKDRIWHWALFSSFLFTAIRILFSVIFANLPLYYMCQAHKIGFTPFTSTLILLISFFSAPLLAYEKQSLKELFIKMFELFKKAPLTTLILASILSISLHLLPSCFLKTSIFNANANDATKLAITYSLFIISYFITPISQILLYRCIKNLKENW